MTTQVTIKANPPEGKKILVEITGSTSHVYLLEPGKEATISVWGDQAVNVREIFAEEK